jgi:predicted ester cyclase
MASVDERVAAAADRSEIEQLLHRYCQIIDTLDFARLSEVLAEDVEVQYPQETIVDQSGSVLRGRDDVIAWLEADEQMKAIGGRPVHFLVGTVIDLDGDRASSSSYVRFMPGSPAAARFRAQFRRAPNWMISRLDVDAYDYSPAVEALTDEPMRVVAQFIREFFNDRDLGSLDRLWADDCTLHVAGGDVYTGLAQHKQVLTDFMAAVPDLYVETLEMFSNGGEIVAGLYECGGTHKGELFGVAGTGKQLIWTGINLYRVRNSKIVEEWVGDDVLAVMQQLGLLEPQSGKA